MAGDEVGRLVDVARADRVADGVVDRALGQVPGGRPPVQLGHVVRRREGQLVLQQLAEEVVVAVPLAAVVERHEEEVGALQLGQHARRAGRAGHRVAQGTREPAQHRGPQQELAPLGGQPL